MLPRTLSTTSSWGVGHPVQNIVNEDATGYIVKEKLEARLHFLFGYLIEVRVRVSSIPALPRPDHIQSDISHTQHVNGRYYFEAPRVVTQVCCHNGLLSTLSDNR